jgi:AcrR family transcriptional regulator
MSHADIAAGLGIARNTLEKHYAEELTEGAYARRLDVLEALFRAATGAKPNVTAAKAYMAIAPKLPGPPAPPEASDDDKPEKLGKKERAQRDAASAGRGTGWEDILPRVGEPLQ